MISSIQMPNLCSTILKIYIMFLKLFVCCEWISMIYRENVIKIGLKIKCYLSWLKCDIPWEKLYQTWFIPKRLNFTHKIILFVISIEHCSFKAWKRHYWWFLPIIIIHFSWLYFDFTIGFKAQITSLKREVNKTTKGKQLSI